MLIPRFRVKVLLMIVGAFAIAVAYCGSILRHGAKNRTLSSQLSAEEGIVYYDIDESSCNCGVRTSREGELNRWLRSIFGDEYFGHVKAVGISALKKSETLDSLQPLETLECLQLIDCEIDGDIAASLLKLRQLSCLYLSRCTFTTSVLKTFRLHPGICKVGLHGSSASAILINSPEALANVTRIDIVALNVDTECIQNLALLPKLEYLSLDLTQVTDTDLKWMAENLDLQVLNVDGVSVELESLSNKMGGPTVPNK